MNVTTHDSDKLGQLKDLVDGLNSVEYPFLKHLPTLIYPEGTLHISISHALQFTHLALMHDKPPILHDALLILNQLVSPVDGRYIEPNMSMFNDNRSFFWSGLGTRKNSEDVVMHIFNKVLFTLTLG
jgi:hypothetical protein